MAHLEPRRPTLDLGTIEVICGSMFSGKSEELIRRLRRAQIAKQQVQIFKPGLDDRFDNMVAFAAAALQLFAEILEAGSD